MKISIGTVIAVYVRAYLDTSLIQKNKKVIKRLISSDLHLITVTRIHYGIHETKKYMQFKRSYVITTFQLEVSASLSKNIVPQAKMNHIY